MGQALLGFDPAELSRALAAAGLVRSSVRPLPPEAAARGPALLAATAFKP
jgi:hypothetical protein